MADDGGRIVVFGDVIDDVVAVPHGPVRPDTDTPSAIRFAGGGSAANTAAWLGRDGADVVFVGLVGAGDVERHAKLLREVGVDPHLHAHPTLPTGTIVVVVDGQSRAMLTDRGANAALDPDTISDELLATARVLHLTGHSLFAADDAAPFTRLISRARSGGVDVSVSPGSAGFIADYGVDRFLAAIAGASILFPNLEEGRLLTGLADPAEVAAALAERAGLVALTLGPDGVMVGARGEVPDRVSAVAAEIIDPTGAGDAFAAGFLHHWLQHGQATAAAKAGARLAAVAVSSIGARPNP